MTASCMSEAHSMENLIMWAQANTWLPFADLAWRAEHMSLVHYSGYIRLSRGQDATQENLQQWSYGATSF